MTMIERLMDAAHAVASNAPPDDTRPAVYQLTSKAIEWTNHQCEVVLAGRCRGVWDHTAGKWWSDTTTADFLEWLTNA